eukprot:CAMPEP_0201602334 /NCGR_PEP_ID=MMETSP0492-20130828/3102_1 /ASSEMBLY_ACC=CAM_ASM_000837 /TAXON_ID=420259 /ORGANISM="Thalassiosira gravida, Strain GMp14c1" /LENGTH=208 /DNA_ID=CAMNT_0048065825 /DNA_START=41 /DNA_END=667 /DNA_ORIENTATION=+
MKTPASIIAGAMIPLGLMSPLPMVNPDGKPEHRLETLVRRSNLAVAVAALLSGFISVVFATVAVNQLTENVPKPAESVWHLLQRDYDLSWSGTNAHFLYGMFSYAYLIAVRSYFNIGGGLLGCGVAGVAMSALFYMIGIVNRGVAAGSGDGQNYGTSVVSLFTHYFGLVVTRKGGRFRAMEMGAVTLFLGSLIAVVCALIQKDNAKLE